MPRKGKHLRLKCAENVDAYCSVASQDHAI